MLPLIKGFLYFLTSSQPDLATPWMGRHEVSHIVDSILVGHPDSLLLALVLGHILPGVLR